MYGVYLGRWYAAAFGLVLIIVLASLKTTPKRYWLAVGAYTALAAGTAIAAVFPIFFQIRMANAFGGTPVSLLAYVVPVLILALASVPTLALYPFVVSSTAKTIAWIFFGIPILITAGLTLMALFQSALPRYASAPLGGFLCLFFLLLWMRVSDLRPEAR